MTKYIVGSDKGDSWTVAGSPKPHIVGWIETIATRYRKVLWKMLGRSSEDEVYSSFLLSDFTATGVLSVGVAAFRVAECATCIFFQHLSLSPCMKECNQARDSTYRER